MGLTHSIQNADLRMFWRVYGWNGRFRLDRWFVWVTRSADGPAYVFAALAIALADGDAGMIALPAVLASFALELPLYMILKQLTRRSRPCFGALGIRQLVDPPDFFSFPSGHTAAAFLVATLLTTSFGLAGVPVFAWAVMVGVSRIYLGVHYPTDVFAGAAIGVLCARLGCLVVS